MGDPIEKPKEKDNKIKKGQKLSVGEALAYVKDNKLGAKEAFEFLKKHNSKALMIMNPSRWEMEKQNPGYKIPITEEDIKQYKAFNEKMNYAKEMAGDKPLAEYLTKTGFSSYAKPNYNLSGAAIVDQAKKRGAKVEDMGDGMYKVWDDETTYRDTDQSYKTPRIIHNDVKYSKNIYRKDKDLVNVYSPAILPQYKGRIPTSQEEEEYKTGKTYVSAVTPEMKKYYADKYFDPANADDQSKTFYGPNANKDDIDRYQYAKQLGEQIKPEYNAWVGKNNGGGQGLDIGNYNVSFNSKNRDNNRIFDNKILEGVSGMIGGMTAPALIAGATAGPLAPIVTGGGLATSALLNAASRLRIKRK